MDLLKKAIIITFENLIIIILAIHFMVVFINYFTVMAEFINLAH